MTMRSLIGVGMLAAMLGGCGQQAKQAGNEARSAPAGNAGEAMGGGPLGPDSATTSGIPDCDPKVVDTTKVVATMNILMPQRLNFVGVTRRVTWALGYWDPWQDKALLPNGNNAKKNWPYDLIVKSVTTATTGYVLVRVALINGVVDQKLQFFDDGKIHGLGYGDAPLPVGTSPICGNEMKSINPTGPATSVSAAAIFYIDLAKWPMPRNPIPFNIGVKAGELFETPIFIDPKIRNDG